MNCAISKWAQGKESVVLLYYDKYIHDDADFLDTINHFQKKVYFQLANDLVAILNTLTNNEIEVKGKLSLISAVIIQKLRIAKSRIAKIFKK